MNPGVCEPFDSPINLYTGQPINKQMVSIQSRTKRSDPDGNGVDTLYFTIKLNGDS